MDDYDYELDSGYNDEFDSPMLSTSTRVIPTSPWYDLPIADEMFIWDFQLYADIAREHPSMKSDQSPSEGANQTDDTFDLLEHLPQLNFEEYL